MENVLSHHGIKGQKWGVRRYQNYDGTLTFAGKKRALSIQNAYTELSKNKKYHDKDGNLTYEGRKKALKMQDEYSNITGKRLRAFVNKKKFNSSSLYNKQINEMTNDEIQKKIDRIRLENTLASMTPEKISNGKKFVNFVKRTSVSIIKDKGSKIASDYLDKKVRDYLGLTKDKSLKDLAEDYTNRRKIDEGQKYFKEGKYADKSTKNDKTNSFNTSEKEKEKENENNTNKKENKSSTTSDNGPWSGTVEGTGTSHYTERNHYDTKDVVDGPYREFRNETMNSDFVNRNKVIGSNYINQFLLEHKQ